MKLSRRDFLKFSAYSAVLITSSGLNGCGDDDDQNDIVISFDHGVASGDPLTDSVVIWTRVTPEDETNVKVSWQVATDESFENLINEDFTTVGSDRDYTVKVDVTGLSTNTQYFYRFFVNKTFSVTGKTKTLPGNDASSFKLAAVSCSNYPAGYFHVYGEIAQRDDLDAVLHLGDYIYEYGRLDEDGNIAYASEDAATLGREVNPENELLILDDYRTRYAQYRSDSNLQAAHAAHPFIVVWDDHEIANDTYIDGAENHDETTEGNFLDRKTAAIQAYFEWLPLRPLTPDGQGRIYRQFEVGNLVNLLMLDTRVIGRSQQLDYADYIDPTDGSFDATTFTADVSSDSRTMLGSDQLSWLQQTMSTSTATWQVLGQQVLMMNMLLPAVTLTPEPENPTVSLTEYGEIATAAATYQYLVSIGVDGNDQAALLAAGMTADQIAIVNDPVKMAYLQSPSIPYNLDAWDGYAYEREVILATAKAAQKNLVSLAGDTHNAWGGRLIDLSEDAVGVELAATSVSSPGLEQYLNIADKASARELEAGVTQLVSALDYCNVYERGYLTVNFTATELEGEWIFIDAVKSQSYQIEQALTKTLTMQAGTPALA